MDVKKLTDSLDEKLFSNTLFKKCYKIYVYWLVLVPLVETFFHILNLEIDVVFQLMMISLLFVLTKFFEIIFNIKSISLKNKTIIDLLIVGLLLCFFVSAIINKEYNIGFIFGVCYFCCFYLFLNIDKKEFMLLAYIFVFEMIFDVCLGLIDLKNQIIPGFSENEYAISMQFVNPNWSAVVLLFAEILSLWFIINFKGTWKKVLMFLGYLLMVTGMFIGGSYAPEMFLFLCELSLVIYFWIKYKKCPIWILFALVCTIVISFAVWFVPVFRNLSTANANFFYETLAVLDNKLGTSLVKNISTFFDKLFGWGVVLEVPGADGWTRGDLTAQAYAAIFSNPKSFIIGYGPGFIYSDIRVHNCFLVLWLEFGIIGLLLYLAVITMLLVRFFRIKKNDCIVMLVSAFIMLLFDSLFCCIEPYSFPILVVLAVVLYRKLYDQEIKKKEIK